MAKTDFSTGTDGQSVHARTTADADKSQVVVIGTDASNAVLDPATLATQTTLAAVLAKIIAAPATEATLASVLSTLAGTVTTAPTSAGDVATTLTDGRKVIATAGTSAAIRAGLTCKWVQVTALAGNTSTLYVGGSAVVADAGSEAGTPLAPGQSTTIPVNDAAKVFIDVLTNSDGVTFTVGS